MKNKFFLQRMTMDLDSLSKYYMLKRKENYEKKIPLKGIAIRKKIHKIPLNLVKLDRKLCNEDIIILNDSRLYNNNSKIYACTHIGGNDIQRVFEAINEHAYLFLGDPKGLYKDFSGLLLFLNGSINLETNNKTDRYIAKERAVELLTKKGNLLIFPEGAWNITPSLPVMDLYKGTVVMAKETNSDIIPVAIEEYDKHFYVSIGKNIEPNQYQSMSIDEINILLRDKMATEKWNIFEYNGVYHRDKEFFDYSSFAEKIVSKCPYGFTIDDVERTRYIDKDKQILQKPYVSVKKI